MPEFDIEANEESQHFEFEVYCDTCGAGLCGDSMTAYGRTRRYPQVRVAACPKCMAAKDEVISNLENEVKTLEKQVAKQDEDIDALIAERYDLQQMVSQLQEDAA